MKVPTLNPWLLFGLPVVAIFCGVCAVTDRDVNDLDNTRIGQVVCGDLLSNDPRRAIDPATNKPVGCVTSQDVLMNDGDGEFIERPVWAIIGVVILLAWIGMLIADLRKPAVVTEPRHEQRYPPPPDRGSFTGMLLLAQLEPPDSRSMWIQDHPLELAIVGVAVLGLVIGVYILNNRDKR